MSVSATEPVKVELYIPQVPEDSQYPVGRWVASRQLPGDATAGFAAIICAPLSAREAAKYAWSLEEVSCRFTGLVGSVDGEVAVIPAEPHQDGGGGLNLRYLSYAPAHLYTASSGDTSLRNYKRPIEYIWRPARGLTSSVTVYGPNPGALGTMNVMMWGYVWHQQVFTRAGGPRRP